LHVGLRFVGSYPESCELIKAILNGGTAGHSIPLSHYVGKVGARLSNFKRVGARAFIHPALSMTIIQFWLISSKPWLVCHSTGKDIKANGI